MIQLLEERTMARASEMQMAGIAASTIARAVKNGDVVRAGRGLYQLPDSEMDAESGSNFDAYLQTCSRNGMPSVTKRQRKRCENGVKQRTFHSSREIAFGLRTYKPLAA